MVSKWKRLGSASKVFGNIKVGVAKTPNGRFCIVNRETHETVAWIATDLTAGKSLEEVAATINGKKSSLAVSINIEPQNGHRTCLSVLHEDRNHVDDGDDGKVTTPKWKRLGPAFSVFGEMKVSVAKTRNGTFCIINSETSEIVSWIAADLTAGKSLEEVAATIKGKKSSLVLSINVEPQEGYKTCFPVLHEDKNRVMANPDTPQQENMSER